MAGGWGWREGRRLLAGNREMDMGRGVSGGCFGGCVCVCVRRIGRGWQGDGGRERMKDYLHLCVCAG